MNQASSQPFAYVAFTNAAYVEITSVMLVSLLETGTRHRICVLCLEDVSDEQKAGLRSLGGRIETRDIACIPLPAHVKVPHRAWKLAISRLQMFKFDEFERVVSLDSDIIVKENIDELFGQPSLSACSHHYPVREDCITLNSGVFVLRPDPTLFDLALQALHHVPSPNAPHCWRIPEQEVLTALYSPERAAERWRARNGIEMQESWHLLDYRYNAIIGLKQRQTDTWRAEDASVLHYTCGPKPWNTKQRQSFTDRIWWAHHDRLRERLART